MNTLNLTLKKRWFDLISNGKKLEEYREIKPYWVERLICSLCSEGIEPAVFDEIVADFQNPNRRHESIDEMLEYFQIEFKKFDYVLFRNGYSAAAPQHRRRFCGITVGEGGHLLGAPQGKQVFIIKLGDES